MNIYTFQFLNDVIVTYEANNITEALQMKVKDYGKISWTIVINKTEKEEVGSNEY